MKGKKVQIHFMFLPFPWRNFLSTRRSVMPSTRMLIASGYCDLEYFEFLSLSYFITY